MRRFYGYLRPSGKQLPDTHPVYGPVTSFMTRYVDQGAFEMFCPLTGPDPTDKIVICILTKETAWAPAGSQLYRGYWSPDGLVRARNGTSPSVAAFDGNLANPVERPSLEFLANWLVLPAAQQDYWPIAIYPVLSVPGREATLNEQRYMQALQASLLLLQENSFRNPLGAGNQLSANDVVQRVVVVAAGGSNGLTQAMFATMRYPTRIHGFYGEDYDPSTQRLFSHHDVDNMIAYLSGAPNPSQVSESDFLIWGKYATDQGLWIHDLSYSRRFLRARTHRPGVIMVGDEDITSTGDGWIRVMHGTNWAPFGEVTKTGQTLNHTFAWMSAENACHGSGAVQNPYVTGNPVTYHPKDAIDGLVRRAITTRQLELPNPSSSLPTWGPEARTTVPDQQLRGPDDPHEWAWGRPGEPMPDATSGPLYRDDDWFDLAQPGAAGTWLGAKEAMLIREQKLYVAGAEGVVSCFQVADVATNPKQELVRFAQTHDSFGKPMSLGTEAFALAAVDTGSNWELVVGTRRHLYRLDKQTLAVIGGPVQLPWEVGRPHHMKVGDVLPNHAGKEIVFASTHGGLVFYTPNLVPIWEWYEPGIVDFLIDNGSVILLSRRGVLATVQFAWDIATGRYQPRLLHASRPIPRRLTQYVTSPDPLQDSPCRGDPRDIELMRADWSQYAVGLQTFPVALWNGDEDGPAARLYPQTATIPFVANPNDNKAAIDIATCASGSPPPPGSDQIVGDHLLMLFGDELRLYSQYGALLAAKDLRFTTQVGTSGNGYNPFATGPCAMVVGDLVTSASSSPGPYPEEIVVATTTGSLVWMHVNDLLTPGLPLFPELMPAPAPGGGGAHTPGYWVHAANAGGTNTAWQARTNRCLSACWAVSRRAGDGKLHVLDQHGAYWQVGDAFDDVTLWERDVLALGARGWDDLGNRNAGGDPIPLAAPVPLALTHLAFPLSSPSAQVVSTRPWLPEAVQVAVYEKEPSHPYVVDNWRADFNPATTLFEGFIRHRLTGGVVDTSNGREAWFWSSREEADKQGWGDLVEGMRVATSTWQVDGLWASTGSIPGVGKPGPTSRVPWHNLRSFTSATAIMTQEAIRPVVLPSGNVALVLGCPGGRVRVITPGAMLSPSVPDHGLGGLQSTVDLGYGGCALAARVEGGAVRIWFGTLYGPTARPQTYDQSTCTLGNNEVATGSVYTFTWSPGGFGSMTGVPLEPFGITPRGGHGIVGLAVGDILPSPTHPGDELVVGTLSGDLVFLDPVSLAYLWHTHVPGSAGHYNSIRIEDLDQDSYPELYVSGSFGIWRFVQPEEYDR
ncbi:MAG: hypothetical protein WAT39_12035 [Planctomycetota bacterium]